MAANTRIKIKRVDLIAKLTENRVKFVADHDIAVALYQKAVKDIKPALQKALKDAQTLLDSDYEAFFENISGWGHECRIGIMLKKSELPTMPHLQDVDNLDRMIRVLESSCDETISVAVGDSYSRYL